MYLPNGMAHAKPIPKVILALYQNDVQFVDNKIPLMMVKCTKREFERHITLSYHLFCLVLNFCEALKQNNTCSNCSF